MTKAIYTAITGNYDKLKEPKIVTAGWDYICFTNNPNDVTSDFWDVRYAEDLDIDVARLSKKIKILVHEFLPEYDLTFWHDASLTINVNLDEFVKEKHQGSFSVMKHPARHCIYKEAFTVIKEKIAPERIVKAQTDRYRQAGFPDLLGLTANGLMIREQGVDKKFFQLWFNEVKNGCIRDQLSFMYVMWKYPIQYYMFEDYYELLNREKGQFPYTAHGK